MLASVLLNACMNVGIDFFTGVPDSLLKGLCNELFAVYGVDGYNHIVAHNEGGALALCAGHFLATGKPGLCYMQNSGLGNTVNPLASLMDPEVYAIPSLLVIGWRGEPGVKDEPQHVKQGAVTLGQLDLMNIPYFVLSSETTDESFMLQFRQLAEALKEGKTAAIVVRKGALKSDKSPDYSNHYRMPRETAAEIILSSASDNDIFVSTTGKLSREVFELREKMSMGHEKDFLTVGSMGHASMIACQIAVEKPDRTVWCLDGDGAFLMHLGAAPIIGKRKVRNLIHVVINNGAHETVGGMPVCSGTMNIAGLAASAGYPLVLKADSEQSLRNVLTQAKSFEAGPVFIEVLCACGARADLGRPTTTPVQNRDAFMEWLS